MKTLRSILFTVLLLCAVPVAAQNPVVIHTLPNAVETTFLNEKAFDQKDTSWDDPVKTRCGAYASLAQGREYYLCAYSGDLLVGEWPNQRRYEKVLDAFKVSPFGGGMRELFLQRPNTTDDANMIRIYSADTSVWEFKVPVKFSGGVIGGMPSAPLSAHVTRFYTDGGKFMINFQDDENNVRAITYRVDPTKPEAEWEAISVKVF